LIGFIDELVGFAFNDLKLTPRCYKRAAHLLQSGYNGLDPQPCLHRIGHVQSPGSSREHGITRVGLNGQSLHGNSCLLASGVAKAGSGLRAGGAGATNRTPRWANDSLLAMKCTFGSQAL
jgi:hypothetical protein